MANISGTSGNDLLRGGTANDIIQGFAGDDSLFGGAGDDVISGDAGNDGLSGDEGNDILFGGEGNDSLFGGAGADFLSGGSGNDIYTISDTLDTISEGVNDGTDTVLSFVDFTLGSNVENLELLGSSNLNGFGNELDNQIIGNSGSNALSGGAGNDILKGGIGNDFLDGGTGDDSMEGGMGDDFYVVDSVGDRPLEDFNAGFDEVRSSISFTLGDNLEVLDLFAGLSNPVNGTGNALDNIIRGSAGNNILKGEAGDDQLFGFEGEDTLEGGLGNDSLKGGLGNDTLDGGAGDDALDGEAGDDILLGGDGNDTLNGNIGNDILGGGTGTNLLRGGFGSDTYIVNSVNDTVVEDVAPTVGGVFGGGIDSVQSSVSFTLPNFVENLVLTGTDAINGTGQNLNNTITGNSANNLIDGKEGDDALEGGEGDDTLLGGLGNDRLSGGAGNDTLDGGSGSDTLIGGSGDDNYILSADSSDKIIEEVNGGIDTVTTNLDTVLSANVENLIFQGVPDPKGTGITRGEGNDLNNTITVASDSFLATDLFGQGGSDTLIGNSRINILDGGTGDDTLKGGLGNDFYSVDTLGDRVIEDADAGIDTISSSISLTLGDNVENLSLLGNADLSGTGNDLNNRIEGNGGNNILNGGAGNDILFDQRGNNTLFGGEGNDSLDAGTGNDTLFGEAGEDALFGGEGEDFLDGGTGNDIMRGAGGNDTYRVDSVGDIVVEDSGNFGGINGTGGGFDIVQSSVSFTLATFQTIFVENLTLTGEDAIDGTGNDLDNFITGNSSENFLDGKEGNDVLKGMGGDDILIGGTGNDLLTGGSGDDVLSGGEGADSFRFDSGTAFKPEDMGVDLVKDFQVGIDKIVLSKATFGNILFTDIAIVANDRVAATSSKIVTYSASTGNLFFNQNGSAVGFGTGGQFASLSNAPLVSVTDFQSLA